MPRSLFRREPPVPLDLPEARRLVALLAAGKAQGISVDRLAQATAMVLCSVPGTVDAP